MTFSLPGFDQWTFQVMLLGSMLVLEALNGDLKPSTVLEPMDSSQVCVHQLITHPCCVLVEAFR